MGAVDTATASGGSVEEVQSEGARRVGLAAVLAFLMTSAVVRAEPGGAPRIELRYIVRGTAQGCPNAEEFRASVARELTFDAFGADPTAVVTVTIEDAGRGSRATIALTEGGTFVQEVAAARTECAALAAASVQAVVLAIERLREASTDAGPPPPPPAAPTPPAPAQTPPKSMRVAPAVDARTLHVDSHVGGAVSRGFVPAIAGGTFVGATAAERWWMASLDLGVWWPTHVVTPADDAGGSHGATVRALAATTAFCVTKQPVFACGTAGLLDVRATGRGELLSRAPQTRLGTFGARAGWLVPLRLPWSVELYVGIAVPTARILIRAGDEELWKSPSFAGEGGIRIRTRIL